MKEKHLLDVLGNIDDRHIEEAAPAVKKSRMPSWAKWSSAIAACLVLFVGIGGFILPRIGGNSGVGDSGHGDGSTFMSYAGPVFPLTLKEENAAISAERSLTLDFAPWIPVWISNEEEAASLTYLTDAERQDALNAYNEWYPDGGRYESSCKIQVTDSYTLTNESTQNQTVSILYPFVSNLNSIDETRPTLSLDGNALETALHAGSYAGGFQGAWGNWAETHENPGSLNLDSIESWEGYRDLLSDGTYLQRALGDFADLSDIPVTVYELTDAWGPEENNDAGIPNPTINIMFELDYTKTNVLTYGFNQGQYNAEQGIMGKGFSVRQPVDRMYGVPYYIIVIGEDIENLTYQGFATGGWDTKKTVEAGVTIKRSESNLEDALRAAAAYQYQELIDVGNYFESNPAYGFELYFGLMKEHLMEYSVLSENAVERYDDGAIENLDVSGVSRVFWLEAEITIPAGESVTLDAASEKMPSYDFYCADTENKGISGYDMVTELGSNLNLTEQTAKLEDRGQIEIVRQNFGFDLANGITEVKLTEPHYYLEVKSNGKE
ncbi:MAG: hypothetical protein HUJ66_00970 [Oscillospiraceae bacterium]|nr:hypothetical protein [Oscillospiraceae bacterium]